MRDNSKGLVPIILLVVLTGMLVVGYTKFPAAVKTAIALFTHPPKKIDLGVTKIDLSTSPSPDTSQ